VNIDNLTNQDYWFGPLHLPANATGFVVDDTSSTSLYLTEDSVADAINNLYNAGKIHVTSYALPFPRPTGVPQLLHGDGAPEGLVYAPQGSMYMRRDGTGANSLYTKTTGVTINTGWENYMTAAVGPGTTYRKTTPKAVNTTTTETDLLNGEITLAASILGTSGMARLSAWGDWLNTTGGALGCGRFKIKLGSTVIFDTGAAPATFSASSATRLSWRIESEIMNTATNSQIASLAIWVTGANNNVSGGALLATGEGQWQFLINPSAGYPSLDGQAFTTAAVDTTVGQALVLSVTNPSASASYETKLYGALVEII
jgi:hypothetical protein